jgi:hypothetical protein
MPIAVATKGWHGKAGQAKFPNSTQLINGVCSLETLGVVGI